MGATENAGFTAITFTSLQLSVSNMLTHVNFPIFAMAGCYEQFLSGTLALGRL